MASWRDVRRIALALPGASEMTTKSGNAAWTVRDKFFAWERPLRRSDLAALGENAPKGPIPGVRTTDLDEGRLPREQSAGVFHDAALLRLPRGTDPSAEDFREAVERRDRRSVACARSQAYRYGISQRADLNLGAAGVCRASDKSSEPMEYGRFATRNDGDNGAREASRLHLSIQRDLRGYRRLL